MKEITLERLPATAEELAAMPQAGLTAVSYTHLTLPTN